MKKTFFSLLILTLIAVSCSSPRTKEIEEIKEMQNILEGVKSTYSSIDVSKVSYAMEMYEKNMSQITTYYQPDSVELEVAALLDFYKGVKKSAKGFEDEHQLIGQNIGYLENQLKTLRTDLENNVDLGDSLAIFLKNEKSNLDVLQQNIGTIVYNYDYIITVHDSIASQVQSIIIKNVE